MNIFSKKHLDFFLNNLGIFSNSNSELDKQRLLLEFKNNDKIMKEWTVCSFSDFLYTEIGHPNKTSISDELKKHQVPEFPALNDINVEFINLSYQNQQVTKGGGNKKGKSDYEGNSRRNKAIGDFGESIVFMVEKKELQKYKLSDSLKVEHVSLYDDSKGYDIESYNKDGEKIYIEVKSTTKKVGSNFFYLTENELDVSQKTDNYFFYIVYDVSSKNPKIHKVSGKDFLSLFKPKAIAYKIEYKIE